MKAASIRRCLRPSPDVMSVEVVTFGCRLNAFESEVIAARGRARRAHRYHRHQQLRGHQRGRGAGAAVDPPAEARAALRAHRRHRLRGADASRRCSPTWPRSIASSAMTTRCAARPGATRARRSTPRHSASRQRKDRGLRHHGGDAKWRRICWKASRAACRGCSCRCRTAATTAAPSASSRLAAAIRARCRWARWSIRSARWSSAAMPRSC